jgi:hypothetical protein
MLQADQVFRSMLQPQVLRLRLQFQAPGCVSGGHSRHRYALLGSAARGLTVLSLCSVTLCLWSVVCDAGCALCCVLCAALCALSEK